MKKLFGWCLVIWGVLMFLGFMGYEHKSKNDIMPLLIVSIAPFFFGIWLIHKTRKIYPPSQIIRREKIEPEISETKKAQFIELINQNIKEINTANYEFGSLLNYEAGYFANYPYQLWKEKHVLLYKLIKEIPFKRLNLKHDLEQTVTDFHHYMQNGTLTRSEYNQSFVQAELLKYEAFFNDIEGIKLDEQQRKAIIIDDDNNLVIAGAGSGKTTTIAGKVSYIMERYKVHPKDILLISFTSKACGEMNRRIKDKMGIYIDVMTFHKFGKEIIAEVEGKQPNIFDENMLKCLLQSFIKELLDDSEYLCKIVEYFIEYLKPYRSQEQFQNLGEYIQYLKDKKLESFRRKLSIKEMNQTFRKEIMKSAEEVAIANFLFLNNVDYQYEEPYQYSTVNRFFRQYKPDFYLPEYDIYIEHFAWIDRNRNVPKWFATEGERYIEAKRRYNDGVTWKRSIHIEYETTLIETCSYQKKEAILLENFKKQLESKGVKLSLKTPHEMWRVINEAEEEEIITFIELIQTFLALFKSNNYTINDLVAKNHQNEDLIERRRNEAFLEIFCSVYQKYDATLKRRNEIDFSDMINKAAEYVKTKKYDKSYKYIIVDEFQDISIGRYQLIKTIKDNNPTCKLFCVGDDWQSIYRFTGSDISLFTQFEKYFGYTERSYVETTYRFGSDLIELSGKFILKNPNQLSKKLRSVHATRMTPYEIIYYKNSYNSDEEFINQEDYMVALRQALNRIARILSNDKRSSILILGRYNFDKRVIKNDAKNFTVRYNRKTGTSKITYRRYKELDIEFLSVHKSKGLEADYVIVINCHSGKYGFPCQVSDDPILNLVLTFADQYENGEERRLFYVAMTRAKKGIYFLVDTYYKSKFITEIEGNEVEEEGKMREKCPVCIIGNLIERKGQYGAFYGCSNFPYCLYTKKKTIEVFIGNEW